MLVNEWEATVLNIYLNLISRNIIVSVELYCAVLLPQIKIQTTLNIFPWEGYSVFWTSKLLKIILPHQLFNPSELTLRIFVPAWTSSCMNGKIMWCIVNVLHYNVGTRPNSGSRAACSVTVDPWWCKSRQRSEAQNHPKAIILLDHCCHKIHWQDDTWIACHA